METEIVLECGRPSFSVIKVHDHKCLHKLCTYEHRPSVPVYSYVCVWCVWLMCVYVCVSMCMVVCACMGACV